MAGILWRLLQVFIRQPENRKTPWKSLPDWKRRVKKYGFRCADPTRNTRKINAAFAAEG